MAFSKMKLFLPVVIIILTLSSCCALNRNAIQVPQVENRPAGMPADNDEAIFNPTRQWAHHTSDLTPDPSVLYRELPNKFRYILMKNQRPEDRVRMHLFIQAGSMHETENERGAAHYLEHMLFNGSDHFKPGELVKYFQSIGMRFGPDANAHTGFYATVYDIDLPKGDKESLEKGLLVLKDYAAGALLLEEQVENERGIILSEKRTRDSVDFRTFEATFKFELPEALLPNRLPIGTTEVIEKTDRSLLKTFYDTWYRPEKMILVLVGDFDINMAEPVIKEKFGSLSARLPEAGYADPGEIRHTGINTFYHFEPEAGNTTVTIETITKQINPPDSKAFQKRQLISAMAKHIINKRLSKMAENPDTPFTSASISSGHFLHYLKASDISAECAPEDWEQSLAVIEQELRKALTYGFTETEIDLAKKEFISRLDRAVKTAPTRESTHLARQILHGLGNNRVFQSPEQKKAFKLPVVEAVTKKQLHDALTDDWTQEHRLIIVTGNADLAGTAETLTDKQPADQPEKKIIAAYNASTQFAATPPEEKEIINFPYLPEPETPGTVTYRETISDLDIVKVGFENGVRLTIKQTDFKANQVISSIIFGNGKTSEPESSPGLGPMSQKVVNLSGLGRLTKDELKQALTGRNTHVSFQVNEDYFALSGSTVSDEITLLFQLYHAFLTDPGFRKDAYAKAVDQFIQSYESLTHTISGGMALKGARFLAGGDTRFGMPDADTFFKNSLEDVEKWIKPALSNEPLEMSIVGDLDVNTVIEAAAVYLGSLSPRTKKNIADASRQPSFPAGETLTVAVPTVIPKGMVEVAYLTGDFWNIRQNRRLSVLSEIVSDRMREQIREKMGAAYSYHAYNDPSRAFDGYGLFHTLVQIDPDAADDVIRAVREITNAVATDGIKKDELSRAVNPILTSIKERIRTNGYWLNSVLKGSHRYPEQLEWSRTFETDYAAIRADEINRLAKTYLNAEPAVIVIVPDAIKPDTIKPDAVKPDMGKNDMDNPAAKSKLGENKDL